MENYLNTRRLGWPYEGSYMVERLEGHRFVAMIGDELAGLSYAEVSDDGKKAIMHMSLKNQYAEFGIGTELLNLLMDDLRDSGFGMIRYEVVPERYSVQIYRDLGFEVESRDEEKIRLIWKR